MQLSMHSAQVETLLPCKIRVTRFSCRRVVSFYSLSGPGGGGGLWRPHSGAGELDPGVRSHRTVTRRSPQPQKAKSLRYCTGKKTPHTSRTPGVAGTHTGHTRVTEHREPPHDQRDDRNRGRLNSRSPGADRSPRPTQKRPPPANPTLPPPASRAPPRACSKAVGEMKARAADA
jgi:hypothetical protein